MKWHANEVKLVLNVHIDLHLDKSSEIGGSSAMCLVMLPLFYHMCLVCKVWLILEASLGLDFVIGPIQPIAKLEARCFTIYLESKA